MDPSTDETGAPARREAVQTTGIREVDAAAGRLAELPTTDIHGHPAIFDDIHRRLAAALDVAMTPDIAPPPADLRPDGEAG